MTFGFEYLGDEFIFENNLEKEGIRSPGACFDGKKKSKIS